MVDRVLLGDIGTGEMVFRVSTPGHNVFAEPLGSRNVAFDSRLDGVGTVVKQGTCGLNQFVGFGPLVAVPIVTFARITPAFIVDEGKWQTFTGVSHGYSPYIGIIQTNGFIITPMTMPYYSTSVPNASFAYTVWGD